MKEDKPFWGEGESESENLRMGSAYPPVELFLTMIDIGRINAKEPLVKTVILSDGKELDINVMLSTDRDEFHRDIREIIDEAESSSGP